MRWSYRSPLVVGIACGAALVVFGCVGLLEPRSGLRSRTTSGPSPLAESSTLFYPLDIGNHWSYTNDIVVQDIPADGPPTEFVIHLPTDMDLVGTAEHLGRTYVVRRETVSGFPHDHLYRQDKTGLYNVDPDPADVARVARAIDTQAVISRSLGNVSEKVRNAYALALTRLLERQDAIRGMALNLGSGAPIEAVTEGPLPGEIAILQYPIAPSKTWHVREDPLMIYTVEAPEVLSLPAGSFNGWRIRIDTPPFPGLTESAWVWYGRAGLLQIVTHEVTVAVDENGNTLGTVVADQKQQLTGLSLVRSMGS
jgi:hypothetical protein